MARASTPLGGHHRPKVNYLHLHLHSQALGPPLRSGHRRQRAELEAGAAVGLLLRFCPRPYGMHAMHHGGRCSLGAGVCRHRFRRVRRARDAELLAFPPGRGGAQGEQGWVEGGKDGTAGATWSGSGRSCAFIRMRGTVGSLAALTQQLNPVPSRCILTWHRGGQELEAATSCAHGWCAELQLVSGTAALEAPGLGDGSTKSR